MPPRGRAPELGLGLRAASQHEMERPGVVGAEAVAAGALAEARREVEVAGGGKDPALIDENAPAL